MELLSITYPGSMFFFFEIAGWTGVLVAFKKTVTLKVDARLSRYR